MYLKYEHRDIEEAMNLLNQIETKGIDNCKRIAVIENLLRKFTAEDEGKEET